MGERKAKKKQTSFVTERREGSFSMTNFAISVKPFKQA